jgi:DNA-binding GntR family transcriptional regulator
MGGLTGAIPAAVQTKASGGRDHATWGRAGLKAIGYTRKDQGHRATGWRALTEINHRDFCTTSLPRFELRNPRLASQELRHYLKDLILEGALPPGTVLSQARLAEALGVSRTPIREALRMLHEERLVESRSNYRATVRSLDASELDGLYAVRVLLEATAFYLTIQQGEQRIEQEIERRLLILEEAMRRSDHPSAWMRPHREFHLGLGLGAPALLQERIRAGIEQCERYQLVAIKAEGSRPKQAGHREHLQIVDAMRVGDAAGGAARIAQHLGRTASLILKALDPARAPTATNAAVEMANALGLKTR